MTTLDITPAMRAAAEAEARKLNPGRSEEHIKSVALDGLSIYRAMRAAEPAALVQMGALDPLTLSRIRGLVDEAIYTHIFDADAGEQPGPDDPYVKAVNDLDAMIAGTSPGVAWERRGA